jgi:hypothetical protein
MRRLIAGATAALLVVAFASFPTVTIQAAEKTVTGTVAAVSSSSLTIKGKDAEVKLVVDGKTRIIGPGAGTKTAEMKKEDKSPQITDFVKVGDQVTAKYDDKTNHADEVRLSKPVPKK